MEYPVRLRVRSGACPVVAMVLVSAVAASCENVIGASSSGARLDNLRVSAASVYSDDVSLVTLTDTIPAGTGIAAQAITFATTAGIFPFNDTNAVTVAADSAGVATAVLRAPRVVTMATVSAGVAGAVRYSSVAFMEAGPSTIQAEATPFVYRVGNDTGVFANVALRVLLWRMAITAYLPGAPLAVS
jgi:hypothetical protein